MTFLDYDLITSLFHEWKKYNVCSIAIGGGEPLLHPEIDKIVRTAKQLNFFISITTNGTILKKIRPDRINISYDELHPTFHSFELIQNSIDFYNKIGVKKIGINHIVTSLDSLHLTLKFKHIDHITLLKEKPSDNFKLWTKIPNLHLFWLDSCLCDTFNFITCHQGTISFYIDCHLNASICSNHKSKLKYTNFKDTTRKINKIKCKIRDNYYQLD